MSLSRWGVVVIAACATLVATAVLRTPIPFRDRFWSSLSSARRSVSRLAIALVDRMQAGPDRWRHRRRCSRRSWSSTATRHVGRGRTIMATGLAVDALALVAPMVDSLLASEASRVSCWSAPPIASRACSTHACPWIARVFSVPPSIGSVGWARENHCSGSARSHRSCRSEIIRCACGLCSFPSASRPE